MLDCGDRNLEPVLSKHEGSQFELMLNLLKHGGLCVRWCCDAPVCSLRDTTQQLQPPLIKALPLRSYSTTQLQDNIEVLDHYFSIFYLSVCLKFFKMLEAQ